MPDLKKTLLDRLIKGGEALQDISPILAENLTLRDKTLRDWIEELKVELPEGDSNPVELERITGILGNKLQEANSLLAAAEVISDVTKDLHDKLLNIAYIAALENQGRTRISAEKIRQVALSDKSTDLSLTAAQITKLKVNFMKKIVSGLEGALNSVEIRTRIMKLRLL